MNKIFNIEEILNLKSLFKKDSKMFIQKIKDYLFYLRREKDINNFSILLENLKEEITDIAPFISENLNFMFSLMIKKHYYKEVVKYIEIIEKSVNFETMELLKNMIKIPHIMRYIQSVDVYRIKKIIFEASNRKRGNDNILLKSSLEIESPEIEWINIIWYIKIDILCRNFLILSILFIFYKNYISFSDNKLLNIIYLFSIVGMFFAK